MNQLPVTKPKTQAEAVIAKFGTAIRLAELLGCEESTVYRWTYAAADGGTDGLVPAKRLRRILELAELNGIVITPADLYPVK